MWHRFRHHPLIGTTVEIRVTGAGTHVATEMDEMVVTEMVRLESVFNAFDPTSELSRWKRDEVDEPSRELRELMAIALGWHGRSGGRFNPLAGVFSAVWRRAQAEDRLPDDDDLSALASSIAAPRFRIDDGVPVRTGDCALLDLNAIAKGYIVDRALDVVRQDGIGVLVNAGGDIAHRGVGTAEVGVENPLRPYDNEPPLATVELAGSAIATSGGARRGVRVGGRWFSHVIDPRTGWPVGHSASITVCAADAATADVAATVLGVADPEDAVVEAGGLGVSCLCIYNDGRTVASAVWPRPGRIR